MLKNTSGPQASREKYTTNARLILQEGPSVKYLEKIKFFNWVTKLILF